MSDEYQLKNFVFSDIFYNHDDQILIRKLKGLPTVLSRLPKELKPDAMKLFKSITEAENGRKEFFVLYDTIPYRIAKMATLEKIVYAVRRPYYPVPAIEDLGYNGAVLEILKYFGTVGGGLFMMAGSTGSGKTTTIYSLLQYYIKKHGDVLVALEDPPEIPVQGSYNDNASGMWYQIDVGHYGGYAQALIATMRYNPRYILLGEVRDPEVAHWALRAAVNGHVVMTTIHGSSVTGAILSLLQTASSVTSMDLARSILADGLAGVMYQKLVEKDGFYRPSFELFFPGNRAGMRAKIRSGRLELLSTELEMQNSMVARNESLLWAFDEG